MYEELGIRDELIEKANIAEQEVKEEFERINKIAEQNSIKVLKAFQKYNLSSQNHNLHGFFHILHLNQSKQINGYHLKIK